MLHRVTRYWILVGICGFVTIAIFLLPRFGQNPLYHQFSDQRNLLSIPNAADVLTNLIFAWAGIVGLYRLALENSLQIESKIYPAYFCFFLSLLLVAIGSAWYHWSPYNETLIWDRLPITIATMSFLTIMIGERFSISLAKGLFPVLLIGGIASVAYWYVSELAGNGDLRPYALTQVLPILLVPIFLLMFEARYHGNAYLWCFLACFLVARICEKLDAEIYHWLIIISGHSLKHIIAGIGCLIFLRYLHIRKRLDP